MTWRSQAEPQAELNRGRSVLIPVASDGRVMPLLNPISFPASVPDPDITLRPRTPTGLRTRGFQFMLADPPTNAATPIGAGYTLTFWERDPGTGLWGSLADVTQVLPQNWYICEDVNACELWLGVDEQTVAGAGDLLLIVVEQGFSP
jgi:hypothetical protein